MTDERRAVVVELLGLLAYAAGVRGTEAEDVDQLVGVGEYGVALESLVGAVIEDGARLPAAFHFLAILTADRLGMSKVPFAERLAERSGLADPVAA